MAMILQQELRISLGDQWQGDDYIFIQWNGRQMNLSTPYHTFKDIIKKYNATVVDPAGQLSDIPLHGLRHPYVKYTPKNIFIFQLLFIFSFAFSS